MASCMTTTPPSHAPAPLAARTPARAAELLPPPRTASRSLARTRLLPSKNRLGLRRKWGNAHVPHTPLAHSLLRTSPSASDTRTLPPRSALLNASRSCSSCGRSPRSFPLCSTASFPSYSFLTYGNLLLFRFALALSTCFEETVECALASRPRNTTSFRTRLHTRNFHTRKNGTYSTDQNNAPEHKNGLKKALHQRPPGTAL